MKNVTVARLNTLVTANASQFTRELDRASAVSKSRGMAINSALSSIGAGLSIAGVIAFGKSVVDLAGNIQDLSMQANLTPRGLQTIANVAMDSGVSMEDVARASEKMRSKLQDALANGADPMNASLRRLGLSAQGLSALNMEQKWEVLARSLTLAKNQQDAMNIASDLFGEKIGPKLRETLKSLAAGMDGVQRSFEGLTISNDQLQKLDAIGDRFGKLGKGMKVFGAGLLTGGSFQKDIATLKASFGFAETPEKELKSTANLKFGLGKEDVRAQMLKAEQEAQEKSLKEYRDKQAAIQRAYDFKKRVLQEDPNYQTKLIGKTPELAALARDMQRNAPDASLSRTPTDHFSRIGLMSSVPDTRLDGEQKKQTDHLRKIEDTLKSINQALRSGRGAQSPAAFGN